MNEELMLDRDFIRCSVIVAELLIKYKGKEESNNSEESEQDSDIHTFYINFTFCRFVNDVLQNFLKKFRRYGGKH